MRSGPPRPCGLGCESRGGGRAQERTRGQEPDRRRVKKGFTRGLCPDVRSGAAPRFEVGFQCERLNLSFRGNAVTKEKNNESRWRAQGLRRAVGLLVVVIALALLVWVM